MPILIVRVVTALVVGATVTTMANTATTLYLHRALSHRAVTFNSTVSMVFRAIIWMTTGIAPRQWVAVHRKHHAFTDQYGDPHSPILLGWRTVQVKNVALYRAALSDTAILDKYARDLPEDRWDRRLFNHKNTGLAVGIMLLVVAFGPLVGILAAVSHANMYLAGNAAVNALGHHFGRRPYDNTATNLQWLALCTMGEGLHNNHHAAPSSPRLSHRSQEIDPGWWVIRIMSALGLASPRFSDVRLSARARTGDQGTH